MIGYTQSRTAGRRGFRPVRGAAGWGDNRLIGSTRPATLDAPVLVSNVLSLWHLEENSTTARVDAVNAMNLTCTTTSRDTGKIGSFCTKFNAITGGSLAVTSDAVNFIDQPFSIAFWVKRDSGALGPNLVAKYANVGTAWQLSMADTTVSAICGAGTATDTVTIADAAWAFVCLRFNGAAVVLNVNGRTAVVAISTTCGDQAGGSFTVTGDPNTYLDEMVIDSMYWSDSQVAWMYNGGTGRVVQP